MTLGGGKFAGRLLRGAAVALAVAVPTMAHAQVALNQSADVDVNDLGRIQLFSRDTNVGVLYRPRPEYAAPGITAGAFNIYPVLLAGVEFNDNIYANTIGTAGDTIFRFQPAVLAESNWTNHYLAGFASVTNEDYVDHGTESGTQWDVGARGRLDVLRSLQVVAGASYEQDLEPRTSTTTPNLARERVRYNQGLFNVGFEKTFNRLRLTSTFRIRDLEFYNVASVDGGEIYQKYRSNTEYAYQGRAEYAVSPSTSVFLQGSANTRDFRNATVDIPSRDSSGGEVTLGANADVTRLIRGEVQVGYLQQNYDNHFYGDVSGVALRSRLEYFMTPLTTWTVSASREPEDASTQGAGGFLASAVELRVDHELLRNLILSGGFRYRHDDYQGIRRQDDLNIESAGVIYLLNRGLSLRADFEHYDQSSTLVAIGPNFTVNRVFLSLVLQR